jgi:hypothetical protein
LSRQPAGALPGPVSDATSELPEPFRHDPDRTALHRCPVP